MPPDTKAVFDFLYSHPLGVVATIAPEGGPRARTVNFVADDALNIYFFTLSSTRKYADLERDARVAFVVSSGDPAQTVQIEGEIEDLTETATIDDPMVHELSDRMLRHGLLKSPLSRLDPGTIRYYKITPSFLRFGDFSKGYGEDAVYTQLI